MNARFWAYINGAPVKLTLAPHQTLRHVSGGLTEEGYSWECIYWHFDGASIHRGVTVQACDCDGRIDRHHDSQCALADLAACEYEGIAYAAWSDGEESQRDYSAEAAGY